MLEKDISLPRAATTDIATGSFYIGDDSGEELSNDSVEQISGCLAEPGLCKAIDGDYGDAHLQGEEAMLANRSAHKPGDDVVELSTDSVVQISECLAEPGLCKAIDGDYDDAQVLGEEQAPGPFTAAQNSELHGIPGSFYRSDHWQGANFNHH